MGAIITGIEYFLPEKILDNNQLVDDFKVWTPEKIYTKTGVANRHVAGKDELVSEMCVQATNKLLGNLNLEKECIDFVILITQSGDYILPATACIIQEQLNLKKNVGAFDINLGCSGYIYGLAVADGMIESGIAQNILLLAGDMLTKYVNPLDKSFRTLFGDAATATIISKDMDKHIHSFVFGTDGSRFDKIIIPAGGHKLPKGLDTRIEKTDSSGNVRCDENMYMDTAAVFNFTIDVVPKTVTEILEKCNCMIDDIDLFVFHQANKFMLEYLCKILKIPEEKFYINLENQGNTSCCSIPIALKMAVEEKKVQKGNRVLLLGFGVGLSWGGVIVEL